MLVSYTLQSAGQTTSFLGPDYLLLPPKTQKGQIRKRYAVARLSDTETREQYSRSVMEAVRMQWSSEVEGERKWGVLRLSDTETREQYSRSVMEAVRMEWSSEAEGE